MKVNRRMKGGRNKKRKAKVHAVVEKKKYTQNKTGKNKKLAENVM